MRNLMRKQSLIVSILIFSAFILSACAGGGLFDLRFGEADLQSFVPNLDSFAIGLIVGGWMMRHRSPTIRVCTLLHYGFYRYQNGGHWPLFSTIELALAYGIEPNPKFRTAILQLVLV